MNSPRMADSAPVQILKPKTCKRRTNTGEHCASVSKCIIHYPHVKDMLVKPLSQKAFTSIQTAMDIRNRSSNIAHKLSDICRGIPVTYDEHLGIHQTCYNLFTNTARVKAGIASSAAAKRSPRKFLRCKTKSSAANSRLFPNNQCLFCGSGPTTKFGKTVKLSKCETTKAADNILRLAREKQDFTLLGKIEGMDLVAREARFHEHCRRRYVLAEDRQHGRPSYNDNLVGGAEHRTAYNTAFTWIYSYIDEHVLANGCVVRMSTLRELFLQKILQDAPAFYNPSYQVHKLKERLVRHFGERLQFWQPNKKTSLVYSADLPTGAVVEAAFEAATSESRLLEDAAMMLHRHIVQAQRTSPDMPWPPSSVFLASSTVRPPSSLSDFIGHVMTGKLSTGTSLPSERMSRISMSIAEDICAATTSGRWKMPKQLLLGMAVRHLTGSAQVLTLLNRFGHCSSHSQILELETAMALQSASRDPLLPFNISLDGSKFVHACFDNFDILEETPSGAGTTHTTHGIVIQELEPDATYMITESNLPKTKQKSLKVVSEVLPPCFSRKRVEPVLPSASAMPQPVLTSDIRSSELAYSVCRAELNKEYSVPQWSGWVSKTAACKVEPVQQSVVGFMAPILHPITQYETVQHCLVSAMQISEKLGQKYTFVTMDLAAAKIAFDIKYDSPVKYHNVIVHLGGFHTMCSYMGAIGKMMCGSGFEDVVIEAGVCASGSIDQVMAGKHFNRAMRVHQLMLDACERLLLAAFAKSHDYSQTLADLQELATDPSDKLLHDSTASSSFQHFETEYMKFRNDVRSGTHGSTGKFWFTYMEAVWCLLRFVEAIKNNDLNLYMHAMHSMLGLLFAADHQQYGRYLPLYYTQLQNLPHSHPGATELLSSNGFSVSRSTIPGCRTAVDMTIEQTINKSAKTAGGIVGFSRNSSAYYRWCVTRHMRALYVQAALSRVDMTSDSDDSHRSLRPAEVRNSESAIMRIHEAFHQFTNPFAIESDRSGELYCLSSGQPASDAVAQDLLQYVDAGKQAAEIFIQSRLCDKSVKFQDTMKKCNLKTFKTMAIKKKLTSSQNKNIEVKAERNLLGRLLFLSQEHDISLSKLFKFPLGPIPWSLATADGSMVKTNKAQLLHHLESLAKPSASPSVNDSIFIIDGNAMLQACVSLPPTFEEFAAQVFGFLPKCQVIHFVTDSYRTDSIKASERKRRGQSATIHIGGPKTRMPKDFKAFMLNDGNKTELIAFLKQEWSSDKFASRLHGRSLYYVCGEECVCLCSADGQQTTVSKIDSLCSDQEEADTRIILHCLHAYNTLEKKPIIVRSPDTDVLVILVSYAASINSPLYFDTGTGNNRRMIDVQSIAMSLGPELSTALPAFHAFTGSDYTSAFVHRGKIKPFKTLAQSDFPIIFQQLGASTEVSDQTVSDLERFVCALYCRPSFTDVNKVRYEIFRSRYDVPRRKSDSSSFSIPAGVDLSLLPPCRSTLTLHAKRCNYVAYVWRHAHIPYGRINPNGSGWCLGHDGLLTIQWTGDDILPPKLVDILALTSPTESADMFEVEEEIEVDCEIENIVDFVFEEGNSDNEDVDN